MISSGIWNIQLPGIYEFYSLVWVDTYNNTNSVFWTSSGKSQYASFALCPDSKDDLEKYGPVSGDVKIIVRTITIASSFTLTFGKNDQYSTSSYCPVNEMQRWTSEAGQLKVLCELTYVKSNDIVNVSSPYYSSTIGMSESRLSTDLEQLYIGDCFNDLTISVKGKNYAVHKAILATRSSVFNAMLRNDMQESQKNLINITDIEQETFEEMLHYIYTGKTKNLDELAFELLPIADKYDLKELRIMCENVVFKKLSTDNAVKILILADMHHAEELKKDTLQFIRDNYANCEDFKNADVLNNLTTSRAQLLKDMLDVFCKI
ncbi:speckle-type POZ protein-like isoform X2 [Planococcus citri]|uniref:speckle-type POZ protein-like isoform X2 n=1 Tax=Planococcus citri TaxID=170843 RepID=UPI0031F9FBDE